MTLEIVCLRILEVVGTGALCVISIALALAIAFIAHAAINDL